MSAPYKCQKPFAMYDHRYRPGDAVPLKGIAAAKIARMVAARLIVASGDDEEQAAAAARLLREVVAPRSPKARARALGISQRAQR
jgi:hypothetical protein